MFHNDFPPSGGQPKAHKLQQPTTGYVAKFLKYYCNTNM